MNKVMTQKTRLNRKQTKKSTLFEPREKGRVG